MSSHQTSVAENSEEQKTSNPEDVTNTTTTTAVASSSSEKSGKIRWLALESNPECMTVLMNRLGIASKYQWLDVIGFDDELLDFIPQPVYAVIFLYPVDENKPEQVPIVDDEKKANIEFDASDPSNWPYYTHQTIGNACGMVAIIHSLLNLLPVLEHDANGIIARFYERTKDKNPEERAKMLEEAAEIASVHERCAREGETRTPELNEKVDLHFIALVEHKGYVWELDGSKKKQGPIVHEKVGQKGFMHAAANVCKNWLNKNPGCVNISAVALCDL